MDFTISVYNAPQSVKEKLLRLPGSPFVQRSQFFYFVNQNGREIQIDMVAQVYVGLCYFDHIKAEHEANQRIHTLDSVLAGSSHQDKGRPEQHRSVHLCRGSNLFQSILLWFAARCGKEAKRCHGC